MINIDEIVFRASSIGDLMGVKGLGKTGEKKARYTYLSYKYGREKQFNSKYTEKGTIVEKELIELLSRIDNVDYQKNDVRMYNEFFTGECDIITTDKVIDVKGSWDIYTFDDSVNAYNTDYEYQLRVYMDLYKVNNAELIYILYDAPDEVILKELERESYKHADRETPEFIEVEILKNMIFTQSNFNRFVELRALGGDELTDLAINSFIEIPIEERILRYTFKSDKDILSKIKERVSEARSYLKTKYKK